MTRGSAPDGRPHSGPQNTPRLRLKPKAPPTGHVDGAWWPHSDELPAELPDLLAVLSVRLGAVDSVRYDAGQWATAPDRLIAGGRAVRLDGEGLETPNTLQIVAMDGQKILLMVVPPNTSPAAAHDAMMTAAAPSDDSTVDDLLATSAGADAPYHRPTFRRRVRGGRA